jgi:hypothetical protein
MPMIQQDAFTDLPHILSWINDLEDSFIFLVMDKI